MLRKVYKDDIEFKTEPAEDKEHRKEKTRFLKE